MVVGLVTCGLIDGYFKSHTWQKSKLSLQEHARLCMYYQNIDILKDMHHELKTQKYLPTI